MGAGYSLPKFKTKLRVSIQRLKLQVNKKSNVATNVTRKEIIGLLKEGKDESARIRAEGMIREEMLVGAMEVTQMMCDLLLTRARYLDGAKTCPEDMVEACASVIYGAGRMDIPELTELANMLGSKFSRPWAESHKDNGSGRVNRRLVQLLDVKPPLYQDVLQKMRDIAKLYGFNWRPKKDNTYQTLGTADATVDHKLKSDEIEDKYSRGTLNVTLHEAKDLYEQSWLGGKKPFIKCYLKNDKKKFYDSSPGTGPNPSWDGKVHFPFHVPTSKEVLCVEAHNASNARDEVMSAIEIPVTTLEPNKRPEWFTLKPMKKPKSLQLPKVKLSFQFMTLENRNAKPLATGAVIETGNIEGQVLPPTITETGDNMNSTTPNRLSVGKYLSASMMSTATTDSLLADLKQKDSKEPGVAEGQPPSYEDATQYPSAPNSENLSKPVNGTSSDLTQRSNIPGGANSTEQAPEAGGLDDLEARLKNL